MSAPSLNPRLVLAITCIAAAGITAWKLRPTPSGAPSAQETMATRWDIFPPPDVSTKAGKAYAATLNKLHADPAKAELWTQLGDTLAQLQRDQMDAKFYDPAAEAYREALRLQPQRLDALTGMAWVTGGRHQFDQSMDWAHQALALDPNCIFAYGILGDAEVELGEYDDAMEHYQKMMDLRPDLASWSRGAHLLWLIGNKSKALWLMEKAVRAGAPFAENTAWCRVNLAKMLLEDGALLPAMQVLQPALDQPSPHVSVLLMAGHVVAAQRDFVAATKHFKAALTVHPNLEALAGLSDLEHAQGHAAEALAYDQQVIELHSKQLQTGEHNHHFMAKFYADRGRELPAALRLAEAHKLSKNVMEADTLAWVYFKNGAIDQAVAAMKRALKQNTPSAEMHYHAGLIAAAFGDHTSAKKHLQTALQFNPNFSLRHAPLAQQALEALENEAKLSQTQAH